MKEKRISFGQGKGSLTHNNREFVADNVDPLRTPQNITFVRQPIGEAYEQLFAESTERYNAKQKRNDRKVQGSYYERLFGVNPCNIVRTAADKRKSFYEDVVQIGKREDSGYGTEDFQLVADCLKEYMEGFQNRNPTFTFLTLSFTWTKRLPTCTSTTFLSDTTSVGRTHRTASHRLSKKWGTAREKWLSPVGELPKSKC